MFATHQKAFATHRKVFATRGKVFATHRKAFAQLQSTSKEGSIFQNGDCGMEDRKRIDHGDTENNLRVTESLGFEVRD